MKFSEEIQEKLVMPFDDTEVKFKPAVVSNGKALALAYVDARTILDRLDTAVGIGNWQDEYEVVKPNQVICKLTILGVTKADAGEAQDGDKEPLKSAVSDALKRAAVKFGIGRYLYRLPKSWCKFDSSRNEFLEKPDLKGGTVKSQSEVSSKKTAASFKEEGKDTENEIPIPECADCGDKITNRVSIFSQKYYQRPLCMKCQSKLVQEKENKEEALSVN